MLCLQGVGALPVRTLGESETAASLESLNQVICARLLRSHDATMFTSIAIGAVLVQLLF